MQCWRHEWDIVWHLFGNIIRHHAITILKTRIVLKKKILLYFSFLSFFFLFGPAWVYLLILTSIKTMLWWCCCLKPWLVSHRPETARYPQGWVLTRVLVTYVSKRLPPLPISLSQALSRFHLAQQLPLELWTVLHPPMSFLPAPLTLRIKESQPWGQELLLHFEILLSQNKLHFQPVPGNPTSNRDALIALSWD